MKVILSSSYIEAELAVFCGKIPPALLPYENKRLYEHQLNFFSNKSSDEKILITLPNDYRLAEVDQRKILKLGGEIYYADSSLSIGEIIYEVIEKFNIEYIEILYGDTLIKNKIFSEKSLIGVSNYTDNYNWFMVDSQKVWCGYFKFINANKIKESLSKSNKYFFDAIKNYQENDENLEFFTINDWLDFGHVKTYFRSKAHAITTRIFNNTLTRGNIITKSSSNFKKLAAEFEWLNNTEGELRLYVPRVFEKDEKSKNYNLEYIQSLNLSELIVFLEPDENTLNIIFNNLEKIVKLAFLHPTRKESIPLRDFLQIKFNERKADINSSLKSFYSSNSKISINGVKILSFDKLHNLAINKISKNNLHGRIHGDFCASNILFSPWLERLFLIDPRGQIDGDKSTYLNDMRYDFAKLAHSIVGGYDAIISNRYSINYEDKDNLNLVLDDNINSKEIKDKFWDFSHQFNISKADIIYIMITLFISMIPLHSDNKDRQLAFYLNANRLYGEMNDNNTNGGC